MVNLQVILNSRLFWFILGNLFSIVVSLITKYLWEVYKKPNIEMTDIRQINGKYVVEIKNTGRSAAKNCAGSLEFTVENSQLLPTSPIQESNQPIYEQLTGSEIIENTCWYHTNSSKDITINVEETAHLLIFDYNPDGITIPSEIGLEDPTAVLSALKNRYQNEVAIDIKVTAENTTPVDNRVILDIQNTGLDTRLDN